MCGLAWIFGGLGLAFNWGVRHKIIFFLFDNLLRAARKQKKDENKQG